MKDAELVAKYDSEEVLINQISASIKYKGVAWEELNNNSELYNLGVRKGFIGDTVLQAIIKGEIPDDCHLHKIAQLFVGVLPIEPERITKIIFNFYIEGGAIELDGYDGQAVVVNLRTTTLDIDSAEEE